MNYGNAVKGVVENHIKNMDALDSQGKELEQQFRAERITGRTATEKRQELEGKRAAAIAAAQGEVNRLHDGKYLNPAVTYEY